MRKIILLTLLIMATLSFGVYEVGEICENISWTDSDGLSTSIYEQTEAGNAVFIFWGSDG